MIFENIINDIQTKDKFEYLTKKSWYFYFKLHDETIKYLWEQIKSSKIKNISIKNQLVGHISSSLVMEDPQNYFINEVFVPVYNSYPVPFTDTIKSSFRTVKSVADTDKFQPVLDTLWVNFQKKHEFNPLHDHKGLFSFVIWMKIPYNSKDEQNRYFMQDVHGVPLTGNFVFVDENLSQTCIKMDTNTEGFCAIFPSHLHHCVYPFYSSDEERITISGNIFYEQTNESHELHKND